LVGRVFFLKGGIGLVLKSVDQSGLGNREKSTATMTWARKAGAFILTLPSVRLWEIPELLRASVYSSFGEVMAVLVLQGDGKLKVFHS